MIPVRQRIRHQPGRGIWGDCHRACLASMFHLPIEAVPHFGHDGPDVDRFNMRVRQWLANRNLAAANMPLSGTLPQVLHVLALCSPDSFWLLGGSDRNGHNHTVLGRGGKILHDPSPDRAGLAGPCTDGVFWVTYIVPMYPERLPTAMRWDPAPARPSLFERLFRLVTA
ncbi:MAG: hypothetical protein WCP82_08775 [Alphaproteobacteria bacterium]